MKYMILKIDLWPIRTFAKGKRSSHFHGAFSRQKQYPNIYQEKAEFRENIFGISIIYYGKKRRHDASLLYLLIYELIKSEWIYFDLPR